MIKPNRHSPVAMVNFRPLLKQTERQWRAYLGEVHSDMQFILGAQVRQFEIAFAEHLRARDSVGCGSGTSAIELCLRAANITRRDQLVLTPAFSSPFTAQAIFAAGAQPLFADVDPDFLLLDAAAAESLMQKQVAAILPVHLYGQPSDLPKLKKIAKREGAMLIQDACQAHGAECGGKAFTEFSPFVAYSFYPTKNLGCLGDGGAVATSSRAIADRLRLLRDGGRRGDQLSRTIAVNSRLDELQACFLRAFLPRLSQWNRARAALANVYDEALAECDDVIPVRRTPDSVNHLYVIRVKRREKLRAYLAQRGIQTGVHYPVPLHLHPAFTCCAARRGAFPNAEKAARKVVSLPLHPCLPVSDVLRVSELIRKFYR
jgi:dTDP-3-amino-3,4,6-trideoxy-alpha-D-glucose transaminase